MNCCHGDKNHQEHEPKNKLKGHLSHIIMMVLCCGAPAILMLLLPLLGRISPGAGNYLSKIGPFLCPIMMLFMIPMMLFNNKNKNSKHKHCEGKKISDEENAA